MGHERGRGPARAPARKRVHAFLRVCLLRQRGPCLQKPRLYQGHSVTCGEAEVTLRCEHARAWRMRAGTGMRTRRVLELYVCRCMSTCGHSCMCIRKRWAGRKGQLRGSLGFGAHVKEDAVLVCALTIVPEVPVCAAVSCQRSLVL